MPNRNGDSPLPPGWERAKSVTGETYFVDHTTETAHWQHPSTASDEGPDLPRGWTIESDISGQRYYVDHVNERTTYTDPRLSSILPSGPAALLEDSMPGATADDVAARVDLTNRVAIITGATSGIGLETARVLASRGASVILGCRTLESGKSAAAAIQESHLDAKVTPAVLELTSKKSIRAFVTAVGKLFNHVHILVGNAGVFGLPFVRVGDQEGESLESTFATNHLGHFVLCNLMLDMLRAGALHQGKHSRVVVVADESHRRNGGVLQLGSTQPCTHKRDYWAWDCYSHSKLCNIVFANEFNRRFSKDGVTATSLHPGTLVHTNIGRNWWIFRMSSLVARVTTKGVNQAAACSIYCAVAPELEGVGGRYFNNCTEAVPSDGALDPVAGPALWEKSLELAGLKTSKRSKETESLL